MKMQVWLVLVLGVACAEWTNPEKLLTTTNEIREMRMWGKRSQHFALEMLVDAHLVSGYFKHNESLNHIKFFLPNHTHYSAHLTGTEDESRIFLAFCASRHPSSKFPKDVFFAESLDGGMTWTEPSRVPRKEMGDSAERDVPNLLYIEETGRLFIFFGKSGEGNNSERYINYVSRAKASKIFSNEQQIDSRFPILVDISSVYTLHKGETRILLHWQTEFQPGTGTHVGAYSKNFGVEWKVILSGLYERDQPSRMAASAQYNHAVGLLVFFCSSKIFEVFFNTDFQVFMEKDGPEKPEITLRSDVAICANRKGVLNLYYYGTLAQEDKSNHGNFLVWDFEGEFVRKSLPFATSDTLYLAALSCVQSEHRVVASSIVHSGSEYSITSASLGLD